MNKKEKEDSYINERGLPVFTSSYFKRRGYCCKSFCLHCPYGTTIKKFGLEFQDYTQEKKGLAKEILEESGNPNFALEDFDEEDIKFIVLKGVICGLMTKTRIVVKDLFLRAHFQDQGIEKPLVESYYFC